MQNQQSVPHRRNAYKAHRGRILLLGPVVDSRFERVAVRTPVPEDLGDLDLVGAAKCRLRRREAHVVFALIELPVVGRGGRLGLRQENGLLAFFGLGGGFLDDSRFDVFRGFSCRYCLFDNSFLDGSRFFGHDLCRLVFAAGGQDQSGQQQQCQVFH